MILRGGEFFRTNHLPGFHGVHELKETQPLDENQSEICIFALTYMSGAVHILRQPPEGGEGVRQMLTIADEGGRGGKPNAEPAKDAPQLLILFLQTIYNSITNIFTT